MGRIVSLKADIPANRELRILLPANIPTGPAEIVLFVSSSDSSSASTLSELADSEFFGMWRDPWILTTVLNSRATCGPKAGNAESDDWPL